MRKKLPWIMSEIFQNLNLETRMRMRANVQGLEEEDSEGDIEIVDFADGKLAVY